MKNIHPGDPGLGPLYEEYSKATAVQKVAVPLAPDDNGLHLVASGSSLFGFQSGSAWSHLTLSKYSVALRGFILLSLSQVLFP